MATAKPPDENDKTTPQGGAPAGGAPPPPEAGPVTTTTVEPKPATPPAGGAPPASAKPGEAPPPPPAGGGTVENPGKLIDDAVDDEELSKYADKDGNVKLPFSAFQTRVARASKKVLKAIFGTDDKEAILTMKTKWEAAATEAEKKRRAELDENARLKEDLDKANTKAKALEEAAQVREWNEGRAKAAAEVRKVALEHVDDQGSNVADAMRAFRKHVQKLTEPQMKALGDDPDQVDAWFRDYVKKNPKRAKAEPAPPPARKGASNGGKGPPPPPPPASGTSTQKRPMQMTTAEYQAKRKEMRLG